MSESDKTSRIVTFVNKSPFWTLFVTFVRFPTDSRRVLAGFTHLFQNILESAAKAGRLKVAILVIPVAARNWPIRRQE